VFVGKRHKLTDECGVTVDSSKLRGHKGGEGAEERGSQADKNWSMVRRVKFMVVVETSTVDVGQKILRK
jgi:hypothetical protein